MDSRPLPLTHLVREPRMPTPKPPLLLLLHGVGSNERDLFRLAPGLDPRFLILSLRAPNVLGPNSFAWFRFRPSAQGNVINPGQAEGSRLLLIDLIPEAVAAVGADPQQVYLMGFSQGAIVSASVALTRPDLVAGAVLMSGRILPEIQPFIAASEELAGLPILIVHGTEDGVLPVAHGWASRDTLATLPVALTYEEFLMGHEITRESFAVATRWLAMRLDDGARRVPDGGAS